MAYEEVLYETDGGVATITLNRPDRLNAWTFTMEREVRDAFETAGHDDEVRVIVLTGAGRGFCAGFDTEALAGAVDDPQGALEDGGAGGSLDATAPHADYRGRYSYFPAVPKPVIGAINGPAIGLGLVVALFCDVRLASDTARFGATFARLGLVAEHGISWMLPRLIGLPNALDMLYNAHVIDAEEARRIGLVNRVLPAAEFQAEVDGYARHLATNISPRALRIIKAQVYGDHYRTLDEATAIADEEMKKSLETEDFREGIAHFLENRAARFTGR